MSGYHAHELCLTPFDEPASVVLRRARDFLYRGYSLIEDAKWSALLQVEGRGRGEYAVSESFDPNDEELDMALEMGHGVQISQDVKLHEHHYTTMLMIVPGDRVGFIWKLESYIFDGLHTWEGPADWNKHKKTALAGYVFGLARACGAEGFVLKRDRDELRTYSVEEIRQSMVSHRSKTFPSHLNLEELRRARKQYEIDVPLAFCAMRGVETKYLSLEQLQRAISKGRKSKRLYTVYDRYTVEDYMFPNESPQ